MQLSPFIDYNNEKISVHNNYSKIIWRPKIKLLVDLFDLFSKNKIRFFWIMCDIFHLFNTPKLSVDMQKHRLLKLQWIHSTMPIRQCVFALRKEPLTMLVVGCKKSKFVYSFTFRKMSLDVSTLVVPIINLIYSHSSLLLLVSLTLEWMMHLFL